MGTKIRHTLPRHSTNLAALCREANMPKMSEYKYVIVCIDGPESFNRQASWASDFDDEDSNKIFTALAEQTRS